LTLCQLLSFVYVKLVGELRDQWAMEIQAALIGWHFAGVMSEEPPARPDLPEWTVVRRAFDEWLVSEPEAEAPQLDPADMDTMIAFGWREVDG